MKAIEYRNFLSNSETYIRVQKLWSDKFKNNVFEQYTSWVTNTLANGEELMDGNPIFSAFLPRTNQAIRIIQLSNRRKRTSFTTWVNLVKDNKDTITELVIALKLSTSTFNDAFKAINTFAGKNKYASVLKYLNQKYKLEFEKNQLYSLLQNKSLASITSKISDLSFTDNLEIQNPVQIEKIYAERNKFSKIVEVISHEKAYSVANSIERSIDKIINVLEPIQSGNNASNTASGRNRQFTSISPSRKANTIKSFNKQRDNLYNKINFLNKLSNDIENHSLKSIHPKNSKKRKRRLK